MYILTHLPYHFKSLLVGISNFIYPRFSYVQYLQSPTKKLNSKLIFKDFNFKPLLYFRNSTNNVDNFALKAPIHQFKVAPLSSIKSWYYLSIHSLQKLRWNYHWVPKRWKKSPVQGRQRFFVLLEMDHYWCGIIFASCMSKNSVREKLINRS